VAKKAPILLLDAFRRALEARPTLRLDVIGDGDLFPAADEFVRAFGLGEHVTLHGDQPSEVVSEHLASADIFVQHSEVDRSTGDEEGMPVAILEAMAGYLVDEGDSITMAERIIALAGDPDRRAALGRAGWARARDHFSWSRERTRLIEVLGLRSAKRAE
jgi:glycosyltransferase involved in cell wall biosynthesis